MDQPLNYIIYFIAYAASLAAFSSTSIFWLRGLTIISSLFFVIYYYCFPVKPMWLDIGSEGALLGVNLVMLIILFTRHRKVELSSEEKEIHEGLFSQMTAFEFFKLLKIAKWLEVKSEQQLISINDSVIYIYLLYNGRVSVKLENQDTLYLSDGYFIGERSFTTHEVANADVYTDTPCRLLKWNQKELSELLERNPEMKSNFLAAISTDVAKKLYG